MTTILNRYRITQKDGDADAETISAANEHQALNVMARKAGHASYAQAATAAGLSVSAAMDRITIEVVETADEYIAGMIEDDMKLAKLLLFTRLERPKNADNYWIFGEEMGQRQILHRWRRDATAMGDLIERLPMSIDRDDESGVARVTIEAEGNTVYGAAYYRDHPSKGHAMRKAMVQAAIDFLTIARESRNA